MQVRCFECEAPVEADAIEALTDAFVAHGKTHSWSYPEQSIRHYAVNYAQAVERLTGPVERLASIGPVTVEAVTTPGVDEWLRFFDHDAFAGNPSWASCYCLEPHEPNTPEDPERLWTTSRSRVAERLRAGTTQGYLARVDRQTAGWVNASFRSTYGLFRELGENPSVIGLACFVVAPPYRKHGVAGALVDAVVADARGRGAAWIEAYPHNEPEATDAGHFRGPRSMFESRGFAVVEVRERYTVMRRATAPGGTP